MSLKPVKSRRRRQSKYSRLRAQAEYKPWKGWNWGETKKKGLDLFGRKAFVLLIIGLAVSIGFGVMYADPNNGLFHRYTRGGVSDPVKPIWYDSLGACIGAPPSCPKEWLFKGKANGISNAGIQSISSGPPTLMRAWSNSTDSFIGINQNPVDLSTVASKTLQMAQQWEPLICCNVVTGAPIFAVYLTRNPTIPDPGLFRLYDPLDDPNVVLELQVYWDGPNGGNGKVFGIIKMQRDATKSITSGSTGCGGSSTSSGTEFLCGTDVTTGNFPQSTTAYNLLGTMNFTASTAVPSNSGLDYVLPLVSVGSSQCTNLVPAFATNSLPWLSFQASQYYYGLWVGPSNAGTNDVIGFQGSPNPPNSNPYDTNSMFLGQYTTCSTAIAQAPYVDTGGFFGPVIKALIAIGIFILNAILGFIAFLAPAINSAIQFLETLVLTILDAIGGLIGYPTAGTDLFTAINALLSFFGQAPTIFGNVPALFSRFVDANSAYFTWLPTALSIASTIASLAINSISFVLTIIQFTFKLVAGVYLIFLLTLFLVYTGDDSLGGILGFLETAQWLILGPLGWLARVLNFILDIITSLIGLIPKPFIQMVAHAFPRIPIIETNARFVNPSFDLAAIRSGNMLSVWAWFVDFTFLAWYNGVTPALPGSLGNLLPGMPATTFAALRGFLPVLEIFLIIISALAFIIWPMNQMLSMISLDLDILDFEMSPGRKLSSGGGFAGVKVKKAKKRFGSKLAGKVEHAKREKTKTQPVSESGGSTVPPIIVQDLRQAPQARAPINVTPVAKQLEDKS